MRKLVSLLLALSMVLCAVPAMAEVATSEPGTLPIVSEPTKLTIGIEQHTSVENWETNRMTTYLEEKTGLDLEFVVYPSGEMGTKLELIVAAGGDDLPDILIGSFSQAQIMPWAEAGMILPLTEYYDSKVYWAEESLALTDAIDLETVRKYITSYDGEIYGYFSFNGTHNNEHSPQRVNFYEPWLDQLGLSIPTNTDELYDVLVAIRDSDANGNGVADEIPLTGYKDSVANFRRWVMSPFVYTQDEYWTATDGTIGVCFNTDEWREGLRYVRKLFSEGLVDPAMFTQDQNALTITLSQDPQIVGSFVRISATNMSAEDPDRYNYIRSNYLLDSEGNGSAVIKPAMPSITALVTKNCENPTAAFMFLDYMTSIEMSTITRYGYADEQYVANDVEAARAKYLDFWQNKAPKNLPEEFYGDDTDNPEYLPLNVNDYDGSVWGTLQNNWWQQVGPNIMTEELQNLFSISTPINTEREQLTYYNEYHARYTMTQAMKNVDYSKVVAGLVYTEDEQEVITDYYTEIKTFVESTWASYVTGTLDIEDDAAWNNYIQQLQKMNLEECISAAQAAYDRQNQ